MAILEVNRLLEQAQAGTKLNTADRRRVVGWLLATQPNVTNTDMAGWFSVSEGSIRKDRMVIRQDMAKEVKEDDIGLVIADILFDFKRQIADIEKSKAKANIGTNTYLAHCQAAMDLRLKTVKALQDLGYLPKNLGNATVERFEYAAIVVAGDTVDTRPLDLFDDETKLKVLMRRNKQPQLIPAEVVEETPAPERQAVYASTNSTPELPQNLEGAVAGQQDTASDSSSAGTAPHTS
jgi:hypothetical protein